MPSAQLAIGKRTRVREADRTHLAWMYELAMSPSVGARWRTGGAGLSPNEFETFMSTTAWMQYVIEQRSDHRPLGVVDLFGYHPLDQTAHLALLIDPSVQSKGWPLEGVVLALELAFSSNSLRKIYIEVPAFNAERLSSIRRFARREAILYQHVYYDGAFHDVEVFALDRELWSAPLLSRIRDRVRLAAV